MNIKEISLKKLKKGDISPNFMELIKINNKFCNENVNMKSKKNIQLTKYSEKRLEVYDKSQKTRKKKKKAEIAKHLRALSI
ncbi:hypothetical protein [Clostridium saccharoperbutylacetonicum]|uniref:hypothetical protein n=1 Tax=Clostridium saccharoperbutylacetonicum TaxID=36745 RepID=UPI0039EB7BD3